MAEPIRSDRLIDWSNTGIPGGIPDVSQGANVTAYGAVPNDGRDDTSAFQAAINAVKGTTANAVFIPAGSYNIGKLTINDSVVLRGESPTLTHLKLGSAGPNIKIIKYNRGNWVDVVRGADKGSTRITVSNPSGFTVGGFFEIQQENDPAEMYTDPRWKTSWAENAVGQIGVVSAINGNTLTLREPLNINYDSAFNIQIRDQGLVEYVGIENLHLDRSGLGRASDETVLWKNAAYVWMDRVHSEWTDERHVMAESVYRCEVRDSLFHESYDYGGGGHGYGVSLIRHTTGCRVENNIFHTLRHAMIISLGSNGNVFGYNYSEKPKSDSRWSPPDISVHGHYPFANLFEGNIVFEVGIGDYWGASGVDNTFHRNCVTGEGLWYKDHSHDQNITGNTILKGQFGQVSGDNTPITGVIMHGNYWNGAVQWDRSIAERNIVDSYYLTAAPSYYRTTPWPSIGGDMPTKCTNPAAVRWQANAPFDPPIIVTPEPEPEPEPTDTPPIETENNLVENGDFSEGKAHWWFNHTTERVSNGRLCAAVSDSGYPWDVLFGQSDIMIEDGKTYDLTFDAKANRSAKIYAKVGGAISPYTQFLYEDVMLNTSMETHSMTFTANDSSRSQLEFHIGGNRADICVDNVTLRTQ